MADQARHRDSVRFERLLDIVPRPLPAGSVPAADRREATGRAKLALRVQHEFEEMPGLSLTRDQAGRLFDLRADVCERVLGELVRYGVLQRTRQGRYVLNRSVA
jgi:hypothetical protein